MRNVKESAVGPGDHSPEVVDLRGGRRARDLLGPESAGEALRMLRYRTRLSREELAASVGVSAGAIANYENDVSIPSAATLRKIAGTLATLLRQDADELWDQLGAVLDRQARLTDD